MYWGVENQLHWVMDVVFKDDDCRIRKDYSPQNLSTCKRFCLNLLRKEPSKLSLSKKRFKAALDDQYLERVLLCE